MGVTVSLRWLYKGIQLSPGSWTYHWTNIHFQVASLQIKYIFTAPVPLFLENYLEQKDDSNSKENLRSSLISRLQKLSRKVFGLIRFTVDYLSSYISVQITIHDLLWNLELIHRLDVKYREITLSKLNHKNFTTLGALPHVDTLATSSTNNIQEMMRKRMDYKKTPISVDILLIGGGHSHAYVLKNFGMNPLPGVRLTLVSDGYETPYSGMLPGYVAGIYSKMESHIDLTRLAEFAGASFINGRVCRIDPERKVAFLDDTSRPEIRYDLVSIDIGSSPKLLSDDALIDAEVIVTPVKPVSKFSDRWATILTPFVQKRTSKNRRYVIVGGGAGGIDLALSLQHRVKSFDSTAEFILVSKDSALSTSHNLSAQRAYVQILSERGIKCFVNVEVAKVSGNRLISKLGGSIEADEVFWCTNATAPKWLMQSGIKTDAGGFITVDRNLRSVNQASIFACGDIADFYLDPCAKAGVFAVREGPIIAQNLRIAAEGMLHGQDEDFTAKLVEYYPQKTFLGLIGLGRESCIAVKGAMTIRDTWLFDLKQWIDTTWMAGYTSSLPVMETKADEDEPDIQKRLLSQSIMRCGGCGSKVGSIVLSRVLKRIKERGDIAIRPEILQGLESPDDCSVIDYTLGDPNKVVLQSIDYFRSFIRDPYVFGKILAVHALSDLHAKAAEPISALALCIVPFQAEGLMEEQLFQMLSGCNSVLKDENCCLVGGHTAEGSDMGFGLSVSGVVHRSQMLRKVGTAAGDVLILTKPIGTGTIMAAQMKVKATSAWFSGAIDSMTTSNRMAGIILRDIGQASSCTDVTGFGLIGHLNEMLSTKSGSLQGEIDLSKVPLLQGAMECAQAGIFSSLHPDNTRLRRVVANHNSIKTLPNYQLLYDPQTSGGLLATVPARYAATAIAELKKAGYEYACVIGKIAATKDPYTIFINNL